MPGELLHPQRVGRDVFAPASCSRRYSHDSRPYGDGLPAQQQRWSYDAAGNRGDCVADNLNRPLSLSGVAVTSDVLGNRLSKGGASYTWDALNRMASYTDPAAVTTSYSYRADGMRTSKSSPSGATKYYYDGQMGVQDVELSASGSVVKVTDSAVGARGVDALFVTASGSTSVSYPVYDGHGNMVATLSKSGAPYSLGSQRQLDAWGVPRSGVSPSGADYCASLGH